MMKGLSLLLIVLVGSAANTEACCASPGDFERSVPFNDGWSFRKGPFTADPVLFPAQLESGWSEVTIPHTWNALDMQNDRNNYYAGEAYYKKTFDAAGLEGKRVYLRFEGVGSVADVYVNSKFAGNHKGAFSAFVVEITNLLDYKGDNEILVRADNTTRPDIIPINNTLFGVYGGIYRPVSLVTTDKLNISVMDHASAGVYISQKEISSKSALLTIKSKIENKYGTTRSAQLETTIYEADGSVKARGSTPVEIPPQGRHFIDQDISVHNPHLWQGLEDPYLYRVEVCLTEDGRTVDRVVQPLGIRHFELRAGDGMYLNGKKVPMYGVCRHQDWLGSGSALSEQQHDTDLEIIREIGATTVRLAHYQQSEYFYSKCDSLGIMVWAEIPFVNRVSREEAANARMQLTELIRQNYNHPSIYIWGLHNEVYNPYDYTVALTADLHDLAKSEDPYRYTVSVSGYSKVDQACNLNADVQGINHYFGWYGGRIGDIEQWVQGMERDFPGYMVMFSEYGAEANIEQQEENPIDVGRYFSQFYPETFSTRFHETHWGVISRHPYLVASYVWNMFDFATPATTQGGIEARNMKGLVTFDRKVKKDPFYWYKANWSKEPVVYITQRRAAQRYNRITDITVYSNVGKPVISVNGRSFDSPVSGETEIHYIFKDITLSDGVNTITATVPGCEMRDTIEWNYDPGYVPNNIPPHPRVKTKEHIGL